MKIIIENLKRLDLSKRPEKEIIEELKKISSLPFMTTTYYPNKEIERAVLNTDEEPVFKTASRLSYKPNEYNTDYQRASTPENTMFYGCVIPADLSEKEIKYARIIGATETCDLIRNEDAEDGERFITFGKWRVVENLDLVSIVDPYVEYRIKYLNDLVNAYRACLNNLPAEKSKEIQCVLSYLASEFSKKVDYGKNYDYMVSAIFTELLVNHGRNKIDGILYPSVQTNGFGLCIAISPKSMYKLELIHVLQCKVIRKSMDVDLKNIRLCNVNPPNSVFELKDIYTN